jgi:hypothetical protein
MKKIKYFYVAFSGLEGLDHNCVGVFTEKKDAIEASKLNGNNNADVKRITINPKLPKHPKGKYLFKVYVNFNDMAMALRCNPKFYKKIQQKIVINNYVYLWAKSHNEAEKIARNIAKEYFSNKSLLPDPESSSSGDTSDSTNDGLD